MIDWLFRYLWRRLAALDRAEAAEAERPDVVVRQVCMIAGVPDLARGFLAHNVSPAAVTHVLAEAVRRNPASGPVAALKGLKFMAAEESPTIWDTLDRRWLEQIEQAFRSRDGG